MKSFFIRSMSLVAVVSTLCSYNTILNKRGQQEEINRLNAQLSATATSEQGEDTAEGRYQDGTYTGEAEGFGGVIEVETTIANGKIEKIQIVSAKQEDGAYLTMAKKIIDRMIESQSAEVDTVSGATFTSTGIRDAVAESLKKAE